MAVGPFSSAMTSISGESFRSTPSRVVMASPASALRTMIWAPPTCFRSKACMGWPYSSMTKLVMSTMLLMGRTPQARSRSRIHRGEGPIFTSFTTRAMYRGQRVPFFTSTRR